MALGPVEYLVISFPGNQFNGDIAPAIADLVNRGVVRILDMAFVKKDAEGNIATFEISDLPETADFADIDGHADGMFNDDDIAIAASALEPDPSRCSWSGRTCGPMIWPSPSAAPAANWSSGNASPETSPKPPSPGSNPHPPARRAHHETSRNATPGPGLAGHHGPHSGGRRNSERRGPGTELPSPSWRRATAGLHRRVGR